MSYTTPPPAPPPPGGYQDPGYGVSAGGELATWAPRVGAALIDGALQIPAFILYFIGLPKGTATTTVGGVATTTATGGSPLLLLLAALLALGVSAWNRWFLGGQGQSLGKRVVGLRLLGEASAQPIGAGRAFLRDLAHIVDNIICYIGYLFPLWDAKKQTIADKIVQTVVVKA